MKRNLKIYIPIVLFIIAIGLLARTIPDHLPHWYTTYFGDFLWAMLIFFLYCLVFRMKPKRAFYCSIITTYLIEISQLFHPPWLEALRSMKVFSLILGFGFLWSDIIAYTLGISLGFVIDKLIINSGRARTDKSLRRE
jgi:hypothetical protein